MKATAARHRDPSVASHGPVSFLLYRALPAGRGVCSRRSYPLGIEITDLACFHAMPRHKEQKEKVNPRRGFSPTHRTAPVLQTSAVAASL